MKPIHIAMACDERYLPGALSTLASARVALEPEIPLEVDILHDGLTPNSQARLRRAIGRLRGETLVRFPPIDAGFEKFPEFYFPSKLIYARLLLPNLLDCERVLYLDSDILVLKSPRPLFERPCHPSGLAAALESSMPLIANDPPRGDLGPEVDLNQPYFNSGFLLLEMSAIRRTGSLQRAHEILSRSPTACKLHDQSALNYAANGQFEILAQEWNTQTHRVCFDPVEALDALASRLINVHFVTKAKPWLAWSPFPAESLHRMLLDAVDPGWSRGPFVRHRRTVAWKYALAGPLAAYFSGRARFKKNPGFDLRTAAFWRQTASDLKSLRRRHSDWQALREGWRRQIAESMA
jgi:lipopolysaccharide biosynthesis glycosyltransferase